MKTKTQTVIAKSIFSALCLFVLMTGGGHLYACGGSEKGCGCRGTAEDYLEKRVSVSSLEQCPGSCVCHLAGNSYPQAASQAAAPPM